jgi:hypothetical protein
VGSAARSSDNEICHDIVGASVEAFFSRQIAILPHMTKLLEQAIAKVRKLTDEEQDAVALTILAMAEADRSTLPLDDETRAAILEGLEQARRGEFVPDEEIEALWKRYGS